MLAFFFFFLFAEFETFELSHLSNDLFIPVGLLGRGGGGV